MAGIKWTAEGSQNKVLGMEGLIAANIHFLGQGAGLLEGLSDDDYARLDDGGYRSSIGQHLRHCLDHYLSFLRGMPKGVVDYDQRERVGEVECHTHCALEILTGIREELGELGEVKFRGALKVRLDYGDERNEWQESTIGRELQFLVSHTVHHYAMISVMVRQRGIVIADGFGIAPSTLKHRAMMNID